MTARTVVRFWVEETEFTDLDEGWAEWSDGSKVYEIDVLKDPAEVTPMEYDFLKRELAKHMVGLISTPQIGFVYAGILDLLVTSDWVELENRMDAIQLQREREARDKLYQQQRGGL